MSPKKQVESEPSKLLWFIVAPIVASVITAMLISLATSPVNKLEAVDKRVSALEISKATADANYQQLKDTLSEVKSSQAAANAKLDSINNELILQRRVK